MPVRCEKQNKAYFYYAIAISTRLSDDKINYSLYIYFFFFRGKGIFIQIYLREDFSVCENSPMSFNGAEAFYMLKAFYYILYGI